MARGTDSNSEISTVGASAVAGGDLLVRRPGHPVALVEGALSNELHRVEVVSQSKGLERLRSVEVLAPSPERVSAPCVAFGQGCGGCQWQFATATAQSRMKLEIVKDALVHIAHRRDIEPKWAGSVSPYAYRHHVRVFNHDGKPAFKQRHSNDLVPIQRCEIANEAINEQLASLVVSEPETLVVAPKPNSGQYRVGGRSYRVSPGAFFQSGPQAAALLVDSVTSVVIDKVTHVVDLYAGVGLLGAAIADRRGCTVAAVELDETACSDARFNMADLSARVLCSEVARVDTKGLGRPDVVVADPPRTGLARPGVAVVARLAPAQVILVSCDPASMARDLALLTEAGYEARELSVLDLFPQTHHCETVLSLVRQG